jgi:hypothetical protein
VTGGGYRASNGALSSQPQANGWSAQLSAQVGSSSHPQAYAVCAAAHVQPGTIATASKTLASTDTGAVVAGCPTGTTLVGGGFAQTGPTSLSADQSAGDGRGWQVQIAGASGAAGPGASATVVVSAVCTTFA